MPRLKQNGPGRRRRWPDGTVLHLRAGFNFFRTGPALDEDDARQAWADLRDVVMDEHGDHHRTTWPSRPWGWWMFEAEQEPPSVIAPRCSQAAMLFDMGELTPDEMARLPRLIERELKVRRSRVSIDPPEHLETIEALAKRLNVTVDGGDE